MNKIINMDCMQGMKQLPDKCVHTCVTSPPYFGLRDYGTEGQIGLEPTPQDFVDALVAVFREVRRVLKDDGTLWLNLGDSYVSSGGHTANGVNSQRKGRSNLTEQMKVKGCSGGKVKDLIGIPWRVAFALQADGWYLRQDIIWAKPNPMPESVTDRCTKSHEYIFLLSKNPKYYFDHVSIKEDSVGGNKGKAVSFKREGSKRGIANICPNSPMPTHRPDRDDTHYDGPMRNRRDVWTVATKPCKVAHFATFPPELIRPCIIAGAPVGGLVLDPFMGAGTTGMVAKQEGRNYVGFELNPAYIEIAERRIANAVGPIKITEEEI